MTQTDQDFLGHLLSVQDPLGFITQFRHSKNHAGAQGYVEEISHPDGGRLECRYDKPIRLAEIINAEVKVITWNTAKPDN